MNLLLILLSVMTFTVETKTTVSMSGNWPYGIDAAYECSYQKGQVRNGDVATLSLTGLGGIVVEQVEVYVKSNKEAGAGTFEVMVNGSTASTKSGSLKNWVGKFDNQNYHAVSLLGKSFSDVHELTIRLTGTVRSLYIERYVITYGAAPEHTVTLMKGDEVYETLREASGGQGVVLPGMESEPDWQFCGWTKTPFESEMTTSTSWYPFGCTYYPSEDETLWAVYAYEPEQTVYEQELVSGDYIYMDASNLIAMTGVPVSGKMGATFANIEDLNQWYTIEFTASGDSATIRHKATGTCIGYSGTKLVEKNSQWAVYHDGPVTAFYTTTNNHTYMLFPGYDYGGGEYTQLFLVTDVSQAYTALVSTEPVEVIYSCYPERLQAIEQVEEEKHEVIVPFGIYELHIKDGHKRLRIR